MHASSGGRRGSGSNGSDGGAPTGASEVPAAVRQAIAAAVMASPRQEVLVEYARALGPDPALADLDDRALEEQLRTGAAEIAAATCRWLGFVAEFVVRGHWVEQGARTPAAWLSWAVGLAPSTAREHLRVALRLRELPAIHERFAAGTISYSKVRAITRVATPATEQLLLDWADAAPAHVLERIIADARRQQQVEVRDEDEPVEGMTLARRWRSDGTYELVLHADGATGLQVDAYVDRLLELDQPEAEDHQERDPGPGDEVCGGPVVLPQPSRAQREADLLLGALAAAVRAGPDDTSGADRHLVVAHTTVAELLAASDEVAGASASAEAAAAADVDPEAPDDAAASSAEAAGRRRRAVVVRDGRGRPRAMSARSMWRWACAAGLDLVVDGDGGHPADLGRSRRLPDARLRRLLQVRDRSCRFPACGAVSYLDAHHVVHWKDGGATDLGNLVLLCGFHHRLVHGDGWRLEAAGAGRWTFHHDDRRQAWARPLSGASAEAVLAAGRAHANDMDPDVAATLLQPVGWDGDHDHALAVEVLAHRLAAAA